MAFRPAFRFLGQRSGRLQGTLILLLMSLMLHDQFAPAAIGLSSPWSVLAMVPGIPLAMVAGYALACRSALSALNHGRGPAAIGRLERISRIYRLAILLHFAAMLWLGLLTLLRHGLGRFGQWPLWTELVFLAIPLTLILAGWWCDYPIDQRLRQATLLSRLDAGLPIHAIWTRGEYLTYQVRMQWGLFGIPLLAITCWRHVSEGLSPMLATWWNPLSQQATHGWLLFFGSVGVYFLTPWAMRYWWETRPLPPGELRSDLLGLCRMHAVKVQQLLLWQTHGSLANAAVMGLARPVRFILMTDSLLQTLKKKEVHAVMAHELAHVRKHHLVGLLIALIASLETAAIGVTLLLESLVWLVDRFGLTERLPHWLRSADASSQAQEMGVLLWSLAMTAGIFGWISRRFERQADTFAVQHLARMKACDHPPTLSQATIDPESAMTMVRALDQVAAANRVSIHKRSWRHGSIAWRQDYLRTLIGQPIDSLGIDRQVAWIGRLSLLGLALAIANELGWL